MRGEGKHCTYVGCVYMPTDSICISVVDSCYERLKEDVLSFRKRKRLFCWVISMPGLVNLYK